MLMFLSLIAELCKQAKLEKYQRDNWIAPKTPIYPLKVCGKGEVAKPKKRKIKKGKSIKYELESSRPS